MTPDELAELPRPLAFLLPGGGALGAYQVGVLRALTGAGVVPDMLNFAKCVTNGVFPLGGVICRDFIYDAMMNTSAPQWAVEFFHGYTYSGHPLAAAAGLATLDLYEEEGLFQRAADLAPQWERAVHSLRGRQHVIDVRNIGLVGAVELEPRDGKPGTRAFDVFTDCFKRGVLVRQTGDIIALSPPLIIEPAQMQEIVGVLGEAIDAVA